MDRCRREATEQADKEIENVWIHSCVSTDESREVCSADCIWRIFDKGTITYGIENDSTVCIMVKFNSSTTHWENLSLWQQRWVVNYTWDFDLRQS